MKIQPVFFWSEVQRFSRLKLKFFRSQSQTLMPLVLYKMKKACSYPVPTMVVMQEIQGCDAVIFQMENSFPPIDFPAERMGG